MNDREKLVEIVKISADYCLPSNTEDFHLDMFVTALLSHGVTVQELGGCDFCQKFDFAGARAEVNKYGAHISLAVCNTKFPYTERFKFCPMCGRRLPQPPKGE